MNAASPQSHSDESLLAGQSELVSVLSLLVECMQGVPSPNLDDTESRRQAVQRALTAAIGTERRIANLREQVARLQKLAVTDELTGLLNRRGFEAELQRTLALARRHCEEGMLIYLDLDDFKDINDTYGHAAGDAVLCHVGHLLTCNIRPTDAVGRLGGDEFAIVLARASVARAYKRARALERIVNSGVVPWHSESIRLCASFGVHPYRPGDVAGDLLARADASMYESKRRQAGSIHRKIA
jgi:diguanylate cyclase (GGDEF)-like protein